MIRILLHILTSLSIVIYTPVNADQNNVDQKVRKAFNRLSNEIEPGSSIDGKTSIAIMDFKVIGINENDARALTERLRSEVINLNIYIVLERSAIQAVIKEQKFQYSGVVDEGSASDLGKVIGAEFCISKSDNENTLIVLLD